MLLLSSPRCGHQRRASLLLLAAVLLCVVPATASLPAGSKCPRHIDCAKEGRRFCKPGSSHCGPCLPSLEENEEGICVAKRRHHHAKISQMYPDLDEEIDYLHSYIEKQQVSEIKSSTKQPKRPVPPVVPKPKSQARLSTNATAATTAAQPAASAHSNASTPRPGATAADGRAAPVVAPVNNNDNFIVLMVSVCVVVGAVAVIMATVCYVRLQKESRLAQKVDYPAFKGAGAPTATANGSSVGDKTLAQSAQMYHYQHQKQQMLSMGNHKPEQKAVDTEVTSDEEEVGGDFTVYECPGLAPTGEMEVKNPLFDDSTLHYQGNQK